MNRAPETCTNLGYFHMARGLGMVLILLGHSITPFFNSVEAELALFSGAGSVLGGGIMAMFFMISGIGFYSRSPKKCLSMQSKLLLKPYLITTAAIVLTKVLLALIKQRPFPSHGGELVLTYLLGLNAEGGGTLFGIPVDSVSIFWFILALFGGWIIYNGISRLRSSRLRTALVIGCVVLSWLLTLISDVWPYCLPMMLLSVGYLTFGYEIRQRHLLERNLPVWCWVLIWLIALISAAFGSVSIVSCHWRLGLIDVAGSFCVGYLLMRLYCRVHSALRRGSALLETIGFYSIWIVFLHGYEKVIFPWHRLGMLFPDNPALCVCLCFILRCLVIFGLYRLISAVKRKLHRKRRRIITIDM